MKMLQKKCKKSIVSICMALALVITCISGFPVHAEGGTAALTQLRSMSASAYAGTGTSADPWHIAVAGNESGTNTAFTAPSGFWGDSSSPNGVTDDAVVFERFTGDTTAGKLISSMAFDLGANGTDVWDGTWTYAFRVAPWTGFDTTTGDLRLGFCFKGDFSFYFDDWTFKFDAVTLTANLEEDKQVEAGDTISLTHIGAYNPNQTSRGTNYVVNYDDTSNVEISDANSACGFKEFSQEYAVVTAVVDEDGYATFSGDDMIVYGGNYQVAIVDVPVSAVIVSNQGNNKITEKNGTLQLTASVMPEDATTKDVTWSIVAGADKATLNQSGLLTAVADGSVTVRATSVADESIYGECTIQISGQQSTGQGGTDSGSSTTTSPKTGDTSAVPAMAVAVMIAAGAMVLVVRRKTYCVK